MLYVAVEKDSETGCRGDMKIKDVQRLWDWVSLRNVWET